MQHEQLMAAEAEWDRINADPNWEQMAQDAEIAATEVEDVRRRWSKTEAFNDVADAQFKALIETLEADANYWRSES